MTFVELHTDKCLLTCVHTVVMVGGGERQHLHSMIDLFFKCFGRWHEGQQEHPVVFPVSAFVTGLYSILTCFPNGNKVQNGACGGDGGLDLRYHGGSFVCWALKDVMEYRAGGTILGWVILQQSIVDVMVQLGTLLSLYIVHILMEVEPRLFALELDVYK